MRYDDRLATVLRVPPAGGNVARIQFRQLLDLLGTRPVDEQGDLLDLAYLRLAELCAQIPAPDRAAILRQGGHRLRSPRLVLALAMAEPVVAHAAFQAAQLADNQWLDLIPALPLAHRGLLRSRSDLGPEPLSLLARLGIGNHQIGDPQTDHGADHGDNTAEASSDPVPAELPAPGISALIRRIETFRQSRVADQGAEVPAAPLDLATPHRITSFDFTSDSDGRIMWSENHVAPMVVGHTLANGRAASTMHLHQPLRGAVTTLSGAPAIAGEWQVDAIPRFDPGSGRYLGHIGRFRRPAQPLGLSTAPDSEADRLRQLLHELRTPVNAIQGFAEIIQQQLFGPAPHEYRALAAAISSDSARILAGFEELDRFVRLDSGDLALAGGSADLADCLAATVSRLQPHDRCGAPLFELECPATVPVSLTEEDTERLCWRLLSVLAGHAGDGETLPVALVGAPVPTLRMGLPLALAGLEDAALYHAPAAPDAQGISAGMFGTGFSLRLAGAEARAAGGSLLRDGAMLILTLPGPAPLVALAPDQRAFHPTAA